MESNTYQLIIEILEPSTNTLLFSKIEPSISKFSIRRELISDINTFDKVLDIKNEYLTQENRELHQSDRHWYNYTSFEDKESNELIHLDVDDLGAFSGEDKMSFVNCHVVIRSNKDGSILYEFGEKEEK